MNSFKTGDYVLNLDQLGLIIDVRADGLLVLYNVRIGKWIADPTKCTLYKYQHKA